MRHLVLAVVLVSCTSARDARLDSAAAGAGANVDVKASYTQYDSLSLDQSHAAVNRFARFGAAAVHELLPDTGFCTTYYTSAGATHCYHAYAGEPFRTQRLDAFALPHAATADTILARALGRDYADMRPILFVQELVSGSDIRCASFFVNEVRPSEADTTFLRFATAPRGATLSGVGCEIAGRHYRIEDQSPEVPFYELWDSWSDERGRRIILFQRHGDEAAELRWFAIEGDTLRQLGNLPLWNL